MEREQVKEIARKAGFTLREQLNGDMDLDPYVYSFVENLFEKSEELILLRNLHYDVRGVARYNGVDKEKATEYYKSMTCSMHCVNDFNHRNEDF